MFSKIHIQGKILFQDMNWDQKIIFFSKIVEKLALWKMKKC